MGGRKLLNVSLQTLFFSGFLGFLFLVTLLSCLELKSIIVQQVSVAKETANLRRRK